MDKVSKYLDAKLYLIQYNEKQKEENPKFKKQSVFFGNRHAYAVLFLRLVVKELEINLEFKDIVDISSEFRGKLDAYSIKIAQKNLSKVFKDWFRQGSSPNCEMSKITEKLQYPEELKQVALVIANNNVLREELQSCHPMTIIGVALYMLNQRMPKKYVKQHQITVKKISELVGKQSYSIKQWHSRVRSLEKIIIPA